MIKKNKVYGDRICRACKGLCHKNSFKTRHKIRNIYYCCKGCLERDKTAIKAMEVGISIEWVIKERFEQIDVFTKGDTNGH